MDKRLCRKLGVVTGLTGVTLLGVAALSGGGLYSLFTGDVETNTVVSAGSVDITMKNNLVSALSGEQVKTYYADHLANLAPGDVRYRVINVTNNGNVGFKNMQGYVSVAGAAGSVRNESYTDLDKSVKNEVFGGANVATQPSKISLKLETCSVPWQGVTGSSVKPTCGGNVSTLYTFNDGTVNRAPLFANPANNKLKPKEAVNILATYQLDPNTTTEYAKSVTSFEYIYEATQRDGQTIIGDAVSGK